VALAVGLEGPPVVVDSIDRDLVRQVIDKNRLQIRYCYERELQRDHSLEGKVSVKWLIGGTGRVARVIILDSSLGNAAVLRCIEEKIMTWQFPAPAGGGKVEVNYAFVFAANG
jgi:outer membrane biosynthesis protein TonB